jgi:hypothetical protein
LFKDVDEAYTKNPKSEDLLWLRNNAQQLSSAGRLVASELVPLRDLPVVSDKNEMLPRVLAIAEGVLENTNATFSKKEFTAFCTAFEETTPLEFHEIGALVPTLKLVVLERIATCGRSAVDDPTSKAGKGVVPNIRILQHVTQTSWKDELETLIPLDRILREDPAGAYTAMDIESRKYISRKSREDCATLRSDRNGSRKRSACIGAGDTEEKVCGSEGWATRISYWLLPGRRRSGCPLPKGRVPRQL